MTFSVLFSRAFNILFSRAFSMLFSIAFTSYLVEHSVCDVTCAVDLGSLVFISLGGTITPNWGKGGRTDGQRDGGIG